jgi:hypothetical protein
MSALLMQWGNRPIISSCAYNIMGAYLICPNNTLIKGSNRCAGSPCLCTQKGNKLVPWMGLLALVLSFGCINVPNSLIEKCGLYIESVQTDYCFLIDLI